MRVSKEDKLFGSYSEHQPLLLEPAKCDFVLWLVQVNARRGFARKKSFGVRIEIQPGKRCPWSCAQHYATFKESVRCAAKLQFAYLVTVEIPKQNVPHLVANYDIVVIPTCSRVRRKRVGACCGSKGPHQAQTIDDGRSC